MSDCLSLWCVSVCVSESVCMSVCNFVCLLHVSMWCLCVCICVCVCVCVLSVWRYVIPSFDPPASMYLNLCLLIFPRFLNLILRLQIVESLRECAELLVWGDKHNPMFFE